MESIVRNSLQSFSGLSVLDTPIYLIGITAIFGLIKLPNYEITTFHWFILFSILLVILIMCIFFVLAKQNYITKNHELKIKLSRSGSIVAAIGALIFSGDEALRYPFLFFFICIPVLIQVIVFALYLVLKEENIKRESSFISKFKMPSYLQLTLLTSALLIGLAKNSHNFGEHLMLSKANSDKYYQPRADHLEKVDLSITKTLTKIMSDVEKEDVVKTEVSLRNSYDDLLTYSEVTSRYYYINYSFVGVWASCIVIWIYVLFFKKYGSNSNGNGSNNDPERSSSPSTYIWPH